MQVDDRVSIKTVHWRQSAPVYDGQVCRFGASDAIMIEGVHYHIEGTFQPTATFNGIALSKNPGHELNPPNEIAEWWTDESLYLRYNWFTVNTSGAERAIFLGHSDSNDGHHIVVPSRQIAVAIQIGGAASLGMLMEIYFREVRLSKEEVDLLNITWGKYRR